MDGLPDERKQKKKRDSAQLRVATNEESTQEDKTSNKTVTNGIAINRKTAKINSARQHQSTPTDDMSKQTSQPALDGEVRAKSSPSSGGSSPSPRSRRPSDTDDSLPLEGKTKTKKVVKVIRKVDGATIKKEMAALKDANDELKRQNVVVSERVKELEEQAKVKDEQIERLKIQLIALQFLKSTAQSSPRGKRRATTSLCDGAAAQVTGIKMNKPATKGKRVSALWEEKFRVFQKLPEVDHKIVN